VAFSGGSGTSDDPYKISTIQDFKDMDSLFEYIDKNFIQINDLDFSSETIDRFVGFSTIEFRGTYDGQNYKIKNVTILGISSEGYEGKALFLLTSGGTFKNIVLDNVNIQNADSYPYAGILVAQGSNTSFDNIIINSNCTITGTDGIGGLAGLNLGGTFTNCTSSVTINGQYRIGSLCGISSYEAKFDTCSNTVSCILNGIEFVGGIAGRYGDYTDCTNNINITGNYHIGGISGEAYKALNCINNGNITGNNNYIGGIFGKIEDSAKFCKNNGIISGDSYVGGIAGIGNYDIDGTEDYDGCSVEFCKNFGTVSGVEYIGGLAGMLGYALCCSNEADITGTGDYIGGIVGYSDSVSHCYNANSISGVNYVGGITGYELGKAKDAVHYADTISDTGRTMISWLNLSKGNITAVTYGGGLCGYSVSMTNSVALMANIVRSSGTATTFGRLYGGMATAFTTFGQGLTTSTFNGSGDTPSHDETATGKDGSDLSAANAKSKTYYGEGYKMVIYFYDAVTAPDNFWTIVEGSTYPYHVATYSDNIEDYSDFPNADKTTTGKDGGSETAIKTPSTYTNNGWNAFFWNLIQDSYPDHYLTEESTYFFDTIIAIGDNGTDVSLANAKKETTYTTLGWDFSTLWLIYENTTYPFLSGYIPMVSFFKIYTGSEWNVIPLKQYSGTEWIPIATKKYSGTEWV
jgi:hypothetical protein